MKIKSMTFLIISLEIMSLQARTADVDKWMHTIVSPNHYASFSDYYNKFITQESKKSPAQRKKRIMPLKNQGKAFVGIKKEAWSKSLSLALKKWPAKKRSKFFIRCGLYDQFLGQQALDKATMWQKIRSYAAATTTSMTRWINSLTHGYLYS